MAPTSVVATAMGLSQPPECTSSAKISLSHVFNTEAFENEKAFQIFVPIDPNFPKTNVQFKLYDDILAHDARAHGLEKFDIDKNGFQFMNHAFNDQLSADLIRGPNGQAALDAYLKALGPWLEDALPAEHVILYDWRVSGWHPEFVDNPSNSSSSYAAILEVPSARRRMSQAQIDFFFYPLRPMSMLVSILSGYRIDLWVFIIDSSQMSLECVGIEWCENISRLLSNAD